MRLNLRDACNTTFEALFNPLFQRHHGDGAVFTSTKEAKLNHAAFLVEAYELDIPAIRFERRAYRLQHLFDLRFDGIWHEHAWAMQRFECVKNLGGFSCTSQRNKNNIEYVLEMYPELAVGGRNACFRLAVVNSCDSLLRVKG